MQAPFGLSKQAAGDDAGVAAFNRAWFFASQYPAVSRRPLSGHSLEFAVFVAYGSAVLARTCWPDFDLAVNGVECPVIARRARIHIIYNFLAYIDYRFGLGVPHFGCKLFFPLQLWAF